MANQVTEVANTELYKTLKKTLTEFKKTKFNKLKSDYAVVEKFYRDTQSGSKTSKVTAAFQALAKKYNLQRHNMPASYNEQDIFKLYEACSNITQALMKKDKINYTIYYQDAKGNLYRLNESADNIPLHTSEAGSNVLKLQATDIKSASNKAQVNIVMQRHYEKYIAALNKTYHDKGKGPIPNSSINAGHTLEAYERDLQAKHSSWLSANLSSQLTNKHNWTPQEAWMYFRLSRNIDPWYTGGDVGNTQVKVITTGNTRLTRNSTLTDVAMFLYFLKHDSSAIPIDELIDATYNILKPKNDLSWDKMKNYINDDVADLVKEYIEKHQTNYNKAR